MKSSFEQGAAPHQASMRLFDTHAHLTDERLWSQIDEVMVNMERSSVDRVMVICTQLEELDRGVQLREQFAGKVLLSAATGPNEATQEAVGFFDRVEQLAHAGSLQAIGEIGLDRHWMGAPLEQQKELMCRYLELARACHLPLIIHCRKAFEPLIALLDEHYIGLPGAVAGVFHCFAERLEEAQEVVKRGFKISFSGIVTYKSASYLEQVAGWLRPDQYVLETDSPYLNPGKDRAACNQPAHLRAIAAQIANWR